MASVTVLDNDPKEPVQIGMTIIYDAKSALETAIAVLSATVRIIPAPDNLDELFDKCVPHTLELLVFNAPNAAASSPRQLSDEALRRFLDIGYQIIHVFSYDDVQVAETVCPEEMPRKHIVQFGPAKLYDHTVFINGLTAMYAMEHIICAYFPKYVSTISNDVNHNTGKYFLRALASKSDYGVNLAKLCSTHKGFDKIHELVLRGEALAYAADFIVEKQINAGILYNMACIIGEVNVEFPTYAIYNWLDSNHLLNSVVGNQMIIDSGAELVLIYNIEHHSRDEMGWRVILLNISNSTTSNCTSTSAIDILESFAADSIEGLNRAASAWIPIHKCRDILSFVYP
jgi:hypothetical protein